MRICRATSFSFLPSTVCRASQPRYFQRGSDGVNRTSPTRSSASSSSTANLVRFRRYPSNFAEFCLAWRVSIFYIPAMLIRHVTLARVHALVDWQKKSGPEGPLSLRSSDTRPQRRFTKMGEATSSHFPYLNLRYSRTKTVLPSAIATHCIRITPFPVAANLPPKNGVRGNLTWKGSVRIRLSGVNMQHAADARYPGA